MGPAAGAAAALALLGASCARLGEALRVDSSASASAVDPGTQPALRGHPAIAALQTASSPVAERAWPRRKAQRRSNKPVRAARSPPKPKGTVSLQRDGSARGEPGNQLGPIIQGLPAASRPHTNVSRDTAECGTQGSLYSVPSAGGLEVLEFADEAVNDTKPSAIELQSVLKSVAKRGPALNLYRAAEDPIKLNGRQWCPGSTEVVEKNKKVALVLTGQAFRARDFFKHKSRDCLNSTLPVQRLVAENHVKQLIGPLEARGLRVDVFPSITPCSVEHMKGLLEPVEESFDTAETLREFYGPSRVKTFFRFDRTGNMYARMANTFNLLDADVAANGTYEYFIFLRYDVVLDESFLQLIPPSVPEHDGLSFFFRVHDFFFGFPGEMWNCMRTLWDVCMRTTSNKGIKAIGMWERQELGCFDVGPLHLIGWYQGYAYDEMLQRIALALPQATAWRGRSPRGAIEGEQHGEPWGKSGTSAFDEGGTLHTCHSNWFWPPKSSWEHGYMPYFFHVGPH